VKPRALALTWILASLTLGACAHHQAVPREFGRIDSDKGISTNTDLQWAIQKEPSKDPQPPSERSAERAAQ